MLETPEMTALPLVRMPVGATVVEAEAPAVPLKVMELVPTAVMYDAAGMLVPEIGCPTKTPLTLDTVLMMGLPFTVMPVGVLLALLVTEVTTAPALGGMPMPDNIWPTTGTAGAVPNIA